MSVFGEKIGFKNQQHQEAIVRCTTETSESGPYTKSQLMKQRQHIRYLYADIQLVDWEVERRLEVSHRLHLHFHGLKLVSVIVGRGTCFGIIRYIRKSDRQHWFAIARSLTYRLFAVVSLIDVVVVKSLTSASGNTLTEGSRVYRHKSAEIDVTLELSPRVYVTQNDDENLMVWRGMYLEI